MIKNKICWYTVKEEDLPEILHQVRDISIYIIIITLRLKFGKILFLQSLFVCLCVCLFVCVYSAFLIYKGVYDNLGGYVIGIVRRVVSCGFLCI